MVAPRLPELVSRIGEYVTLGREVIVYCWRGGMRSGAVVSVLALMGMRTRQLQGGYKAYRQYVLDRLRTFPLMAQPVVLCGSTGTGKTLLLHRLAQKGVPILDLERLANHRGSVFGHVGLGTPRSAQAFDSLLLAELERVNREAYFVVECESKRIGNVYMPEVLYAAMQQGRKVLAQAPLNVRAQRLCQEYVAEQQGQQAALEASLQLLGKKVGKRKLAAWTAALAAGDYLDVISGLLADYYDPLYGYEQAGGAAYDLVVDASDLEQAAAAMAAYLQTPRG